MWQACWCEQSVRLYFHLIDQASCTLVVEYREVYNKD